MHSSTDSSDPTKHDTIRFISSWLCTGVAVALILGAFNVLVDPYMVFSTPTIAGLNARKPAAAYTHQRIAKSYGAVRFEPKSVILGSSRVNVGLNTRHPAWPLAARPIYNLGFLAGGPYLSYRYLQHVTSDRDLVLVAIGLDFEYFLSWKGGGVDPVDSQDYLKRAEFESRLAVNPDMTSNRRRESQYLVDRLAVFTSAGTRDSITTVAANLLRSGPDFIDGRLYGQEDRAVFNERFSLNFSRLDLLLSRFLHGHSATARVSELSMMNLRAILDLCESRGTRVILFINPAHARMLEIYDRAGLWPVFEEWKREVTGLTGQYAESGRLGGASIWDFSGYDEFSTESLTSFPMKTYWDSAHYRPVVGDAVIARIFGGGDTRFGALLTPANIEAHLAAIRMQQRMYREHHRVDARQIHDLYDVAVRDLMRAR